jgi:elongation factor G
VRKQGIPSVAFINKMDRDGASFDRTVLSIRNKLGANPVPIQMPLGGEETFSGIVDLISMRKFDWGASSASTSRTPPAPAVSQLAADDPLYEEAIQRRTEMLESIAELDEAFMERYLEVAEEGPEALLSALQTREVLDAIRRSCLRSAMIPVLCGASLRGKGVEPLLDSVLAFLPSPLDCRPFRASHKDSGATKELTSKSPELCALAFKVTYDAARGPLVYVRVFSGTLSAKNALYNSSHEKRERINQLLAVSADDLCALEHCEPGEVCCLVGLKHTSTGDTLVADHSPLRQYVLEGLTVPPPVFSLAVEPERISQQADLEEALRIMATEDPSLKVEVSAESGQTLIRGIGELHLEIVIDRLKRQFNLEVSTGAAYVAYREALEEQPGTQTRSFTYDRTVAGKRLFAGLTFEVESTGAVADPVLAVNKELKGALAADEHLALVDALQSAFLRGPRGYPVVGVNVRVVAVERDSDTSAGALRACVSQFVHQLLSSENRVILEPVMAMEIELPEECVGDVLSDLTVQRRAQIREIETATDHKHTLHAVVPLATMLGYASVLRSMTKGEGSFSAEYATHIPVDMSLVLQ